MPNDNPRADAAAALRDLNHTFADRDPDAAQLQNITNTARTLVTEIANAPRLDRLALMRAATGSGTFPIGVESSGFSDRAVGGSTNPTSVDMAVEFGDEIVAHVTLRRAFEGAPGRAHGGIVAAAFDDVTGFVIGRLREPAFTGELTVRYLAPVPMDVPLEMRARLESRERRKLFITAEARAGNDVVATCRAIYITVDPAKFAGYPDPR